MKTGDYYSAGKLLLTGEYLVLCGAQALAIPLNVGQGMTVLAGGEPGMIHWKTRVLDGDWFSAGFRLPELDVAETSDLSVASGLRGILTAGADLNPGFFKEQDGYEIHSRLDFDIRWGWGSSSSLVSNIAWWMEIDPYHLFKKIFGGSGYDVFCARAKKPILFQLIDNKPLVSEVEFNPTFLEKLYFVYLGHKQDSQQSVSRFRSEATVSKVDIEAISGLTREMLASKSLLDFMAVMNRHEDIVSSLLNIPPVGKSRFSDFPGSLKSLGAWGGDFIMAASSESEETVRDYFRSKGLGVIFKYLDLAL